MIFVLANTTRSRLKLRANPRRRGAAAHYEKQLILPDLDRDPDDPVEPDGDVVPRAGEPGHGPVAAEADVELGDGELRRAAREEAAGPGSIAVVDAVAFGEDAAVAAVVAPPLLRTVPQPCPSDVVSWQAPVPPCSSPGSSSFGTAGQYDSFCHRSRRLHLVCVEGSPSEDHRRSRYQ